METEITEVPARETRPTHIWCVCHRVWAVTHTHASHNQGRVSSAHQNPHSEGLGSSQGGSRDRCC